MKSSLFKSLFVLCLFIFVALFSLSPKEAEASHVKGTYYEWTNSGITYFANCDGTHPCAKLNFKLVAQGNNCTIKFGGSNTGCTQNKPNQVVDYWYGSPDWIPDNQGTYLKTYRFYIKVRSDQKSKGTVYWLTADKGSNTTQKPEKKEDLKILTNNVNDCIGKTISLSLKDKDKNYITDQTDVSLVTLTAYCGRNSSEKIPLTQNKTMKQLYEVNLQMPKNGEKFAIDIPGKTVNPSEITATNKVALFNVVVTEATDDCAIGALSVAVNFLKGNGFDCALKGVVIAAAGWLDESVARGADLVNRSINSKNIATDPIKQAWFLVRDISLSLLAIAVIIIAFANVLSLDIQKWGVQRMIPKIVIAIFMTYFSFFIAQFIIDFANVLTQQSYFTLKSLNGAELGARGNFSITNNLILDFGSVIFLLVGIVLLFVVLLYLSLILLARIVVLNLLIVLAPIAFILGILPFTEKQYTQWWSEFAKWTFMGPAIMFLLLVGNIIIKSMEMDSQGNPGDSIFIVFTAAVVYFMAAHLPVSMGGKAMASLSKQTKAAGKWAGRKGTLGRYDAAKGFFTQRAEKEKAIATRRAAGWRAKVGGKGGAVGRWAGGYTSDIEAQTAKKRLHDTQVSDRKKLFENVDNDRLNAALYTKNPVDNEASFAVLANRGMIESKKFDDKGNKNEHFEKHKELLNRYGYEKSPEYNPSIRGDLGKENLPAMITAGNEDLQNFGVNVLAKRKKVQDFSPSLIDALKESDSGKAVLKGFGEKDMQTVFGSQGTQTLRESFKKLADTQLLSAEATKELYKQIGKNTESNKDKGDSGTTPRNTPTPPREGPPTPNRGADGDFGA